MKTKFPLLSIVTVFLSVLVASTIISCEDVAPTVNVPFNSESEFVLNPAGDAKNQAVNNVIHEWVFTGDLDSLITSYDGDPKQIKEGHVKSVTLTLIGSSDVDLNEVFTSALSLTIDKLPAAVEELVAQSESITSTSVTFNVEKLDILQYAQSGNFSFRLKGDSNNEIIPPEGLTFKVVVESVLKVALF